MARQLPYLQDEYFAGIHRAVAMAFAGQPYEGATTGPPASKLAAEAAPLLDKLRKKLGR